MTWQLLSPAKTQASALQLLKVYKQRYPHRNIRLRKDKSYNMEGVSSRYVIEYEVESAGLFGSGLKG